MYGYRAYAAFGEETMQRDAPRASYPCRSRGTPPNTMKTTSIVLTSILAAAALTLPASAGDHGKHSSIIKSLDSLSGAEFDRQFLTVMQKHHEHGVEMAALASQRAQRESVKEFAKDAARSQQNEISEITNLLTDVRAKASKDSLHANNAASTGSTADGIGDTTGTRAIDGSASNAVPAAGTAAKQDLDEAEDMKEDMLEKLSSATGGDFDRRFVEMMAKHHEKGMELAQLARSHSTNEDVRDFAEKIHKDQEKELQELSALDLP